MPILFYSWFDTSNNNVACPPCVCARARRVYILMPTLLTSKMRFAQSIKKNNFHFFTPRIVCVCVCVRRRSSFLVLYFCNF